ncbi:FecCD family ABC transporter permease [Desulfitobacterium chlororespirans]|uniref:Iron complex transport system permease protein n=1 Tax=Desulfitobacterium chlororespirans DSM 11544 TaxID=1121395 RepID=A0A1M7UKG7_9FIRM|nr:iron ABC transporter permease [Desulfitobacterium chlororespirans]SHN83469.1 iron complex transport system permease protein [Desulfitobacterium chlororespirans DSM 11544]
MLSRPILHSTEESSSSLIGRVRFGLVLLSVLVFLSLVFSILVATAFGSAELSLRTVLDILKMKLFGIQDDANVQSAVYIVWNLRLPRAILAIAAGGGLAICGAAMQSITQNVLADPYILGVSSGASAAVSLCFFIGGTFAQTGLLQTFAFLGAALSMALVYGVGMSGGVASNNTRLVLAGMAISIILNAISQFFITMSAVNTSRSITMWMMGSLAGARWDNVAIPLLGSVLGLLFFLGNARSYNLISLGDETAIGLGVNVVRVKLLTTLVIALVTGLIVSSCGIIGLVGFVIPHVVRLLLGTNHRRLFPLSFLIGSLFLVWMDLLARFVMAPQELPIGILTAFCGGPFFVMLLYQQTKKSR